MNLLLEQKCTVGMVSFSQSLEQPGPRSSPTRTS